VAEYPQFVGDQLVAYQSISQQLLGVTSSADLRSVYNTEAYGTLGNFYSSLIGNKLIKPRQGQHGRLEKRES
jgi:hypothetical protein